MLGVKSTPYILRRSEVAIEIMKKLVQIADRTALFWPESPQDSKAFGNSCLAWLKEMWSVRVKGLGPKGGGNKDHQYLAKHGCRLMLSTGTAKIKNAFRGMTVKDMLEFSPDEKQRMDPVLAMTSEEVEISFGISILWLSCFTCLLHAAGEHVATWVMSADDRLLREPVIEWEKDLEKSDIMHQDDFFTPCIKCVLEEAYDTHAGAAAQVMKRPAATTSV